MDKLECYSSPTWPQRAWPECRVLFSCLNLHSGRDKGNTVCSGKLFQALLTPPPSTHTQGILLQALQPVFSVVQVRGDRGRRGSRLGHPSSREPSPQIISPGSRFSPRSLFLGERSTQGQPGCVRSAPKPGGSDSSTTNSQPHAHSSLPDCSAVSGQVRSP